MLTTLQIIVFGVSCVAANYIYQWFGPQDWFAALERSVFQSVTVAGLVVLSLIAPAVK